MDPNLSDSRTHTHTRIATDLSVRPYDKCRIGEQMKCEHALTSAWRIIELFTKWKTWSNKNKFKQITSVASESLLRYFQVLYLRWCRKTRRRSLPVFDSTRTWIDGGLTQRLKITAAARVLVLTWLKRNSAKRETREFQCQQTRKTSSVVELVICRNAVKSFLIKWPPN